MRQAGTLPTKQDAERFTNYLLSQGISSKVEPSADAWAIWIHDENQLPRSREELEQYRQQPDDERYRAAEAAARQVRREDAQRRRQAERNFVDMRNEWASPWRRRPVTMAMIIASALMFFKVFGVDESRFYFSMPEILQGQVWRLVTPIFMHASPLHLLFNMWMLYDLGTLVERRIGSLLYALLVLAIAIGSNWSQYVNSGPYFLGMSGVVFGLFGYAWVRGRLEPNSGLYLRPELAMWVIGWFVLCLVGVIPNVANWAHGAGLGLGAALGYLAFVRGQFGKNA